MSDPTTIPPTNTPDPSQPVEDEFYASWALLILTTLLIGTLWTSYFLQLKRIRAVHETVVAIIAGMLVGLLLRFLPGSTIQKEVTFNDAYFFNLLLPPIILNSGYELKRYNFFRNFGSILTFAFVGTFISAVVTGSLVFICALTGIEGVTLSFLDSMIFGSILSATDPVTILAIFSQLKVDPKLYAIIFGESILNDAVAIVLSGTLVKFRGQEFHLTNVIRGITTFLGTFFTSMFIGIMFGILVALSLKHSQLHRYPSIESCLASLMAYTSYLFSNACEMSGIVTLLFCGITLKHYAYDNMSLLTKRTTKYMFRVLAQLSENFIFIYLGVTLFTQMDLEYKPLFILTTAIAICVARYIAVFPLSSALNFFSRTFHKTDHLSRPHQFMLFWAGLRGAVAFALAGGLASDMRTTVLVVVVLTVIIFGGSTNTMLMILGVRTGVEEEEGSGSDDDYAANEEGEVYLNSPEGSLLSVESAERDRGVASTPSLAAPEIRVERPPALASTILAGGFTMPSFTTEDGKHWWLSFDDRWIKPLLTRPVRQSRYRPARGRAQRTPGHRQAGVDGAERLGGATPPELMSDSEQDAVALGGVERPLPEGVPDKARRLLDGGGSTSKRGGRGSSGRGESARRASAEERLMDFAE